MFAGRKETAVPEGIARAGAGFDRTDNRNNQSDLLMARKSHMPIKGKRDAGRRPTAKGKRPQAPSILDDLVAFITTYLSCTREQATVLALWVVHTYCFEAAEATPYLAVTAAELESGKTRLLEVLGLLVPRPWATAQVSKAALVRKVDSEKPTLLLDEVDAAFRSGKEYAEALRGVLDSGYRLGGTVSIMVPNGKGWENRDFSTFCPKVMAGIGRLPSTIASRSIPIRLKRLGPHESVARFYVRDANAAAEPIRAALQRWATQNLASLREARPDKLDDLSERAFDVWEPLLAIADAAGGQWPTRARDAARVLSGTADPRDASIGVQLLADIRVVFFSTGMKRLTTTSLLKRLKKMDESPWAEWNSSGLSPHALARLLRPYEIAPTAWNRASGYGRGYTVAQFEDAFARYLPAE